MMPERSIDEESDQDEAYLRSGRRSDAAYQYRRELLRQLNEACEESRENIVNLQDYMENMKLLVASCMRLYYETYEILRQQNLGSDEFFVNANPLDDAEDPVNPQPMGGGLQFPFVGCAICANQNIKHPGVGDANRDHDYLPQ